jgi:hypothetical protein
MVTAWQQERRRKQAAALKSESVAGLEAILGGLSAEERRKRMEEDRAAKKAADEAEQARKGVEATARMEQEQARTEILREKAKIDADRAAADAEERATRAGVLRQKQAKEAQAEALDALRSRAAGGASEEDLRRIAMADDRLGELDDDAVRAVLLQAQDEERMRRQRMKTEEERAAALSRSNQPQVLRPKGPGKDPEIEALKKRKLKAEVEAAERASRGEGGRPEKPTLTAGEMEPIVELQGARNLIDQLGRMKTEGDIDTGPIANAIDWVRSKAGIGDPKRVEFKAMVGTQIADYIKSISGATVSESERASLLENVPTASDNDDAFMAKLATVKRMIDNKLNTKKRAFAVTGRPTAIFDAQDDGATAEADALFAD